MKTEDWGSRNKDQGVRSEDIKLKTKEWGLRIEDWGSRFEDWGLRMEVCGSKMRLDNWGLRINNWGLRFNNYIWIWIWINIVDQIPSFITKIFLLNYEKHPPFLTFLSLHFCRKSRTIEDILGWANFRVRTFYNFFHLCGPDPSSWSIIFDFFLNIDPLSL